MRRILLATCLALSFLGSAVQAWAADGSICHFVTTAVTPGVTGDIPRSTAIQSSEGASQTGIDCVLGCDKTTIAGPGVTCGPIWVPGGGFNTCKLTIRAISGNSGSGCGYDTFSVYELSNTDVSGASEKTLLGVLDDDGTPAGSVKELEYYGPKGPYIYFDGGQTSGTCDATHRMMIQILRTRCFP